METSSISEREAGPAAGRLTVAVDGLNAAPRLAERVAQALEGTPGVVCVYINPDTEMAYVEYRQSEVTPGKLLAVIEAHGLAIGDVTVTRLTASRDLPHEPAQSWYSQQPVARAEPEEVATDSHACCGSSAPATGGALPGVNETVPQNRFRASGIQGTWPFKIRLTLFLAAVVAVLGPAVWLVRPMPSSAVGADYSVNMSMNGFTPSSFSIPAGKPVSIQLNNVDSPFHGVINGALHQFAIDDLGIDVRLDGKQSTVINLPALEPGTYEYYCNVCCGGKINPSMRGKIIVEGGENREGASQR